MAGDCELSIVIPAYNEAARIVAPLRTIDDYLQARALRAELVVVDDGSTDGSARGTGHGRPQRVTELLFESMSRTSRLHGASLFVVLLSNAEGRAHYVPYFETRGLSFIDCDYPASGATIVPGEGHPNGRMHAQWAECIAARIRSDIPA